MHTRMQAVLQVFRYPTRCAVLACLHGRLVGGQQIAVPVEHECVEWGPVVLSFDAQVLCACTHLSNMQHCCLRLAF